MQDMIVLAVYPSIIARKPLTIFRIGLSTPRPSSVRKSSKHIIARHRLGHTIWVARLADGKACNPHYVIQTISMVLSPGLPLSTGTTLLELLVSPRGTLVPIQKPAIDSFHLIYGMRFLEKFSGNAMDTTGLQMEYLPNQMIVTSTRIPFFARTEKLGLVYLRHKLKDYTTYISQYIVRMDKCSGLGLIPARR
jgi:hypothetical protein